MRFLRGAPDDSVLTLEEDQLMDHEHNVIDPGHSHSYDDYTLHSAGSNFGSSGIFSSDIQTLVMIPFCQWKNQSRYV